MQFQDIEQRRKELRLTQRELCARAGVHYTTYTAIKSGRQVPNLRTIKKLERSIGFYLQEEQSV